MGQKKSIEGDPQFHREKLAQFLDALSSKDRTASKNLTHFLQGLMGIFSDRPPVTWRFRITSYEDVVFRVHNRTTGRQNDFLLVTPWGMIIMKRFLSDKYSSLFPGKNTFYGSGDCVTIKWNSFNADSQAKYLSAIRDIVDSSEIIQVPLESAVAYDSPRH